MTSKNAFIRSRATDGARSPHRRRGASPAVAVAVVAALAVFTVPSVAHADTVTNTVTAAGENSIVTGATTTIGYAINPEPGNSADLQAGCNASNDQSSATLTVNVPADVTVTPSSRVFSSCGTVQTFVFSSNKVGTYPITVSVSDPGIGRYLTTAAAFTLTVTAPPVANTAPTVVVGGVADGASYEFGNVPTATCNATDTEDGNSSFAATLSAITGPRAADGLGSRTASCDYTDTANGGGLNAKASATYTVVDTTKPAVTAVAPAPMEALAAMTPVTFSVSATDAVDGTLEPTCTTSGGTAYASGDSFPVGTTTLTCSATDKAGNTAISDPIDVSVRDTTKPVVTTPANLVVGNDLATVDYDAATATDLVDGTVTATCLPASGSSFPLGATTVNCSATDVAGNTGTASFTVEVQDVTDPIVTVPTDVTVEATGADGASVTYDGASASDDVDGPIDVTCDAASGVVFPLGTTMVTCTATDAAGNVGDNSFTVTIEDTTAPELTVPDDIVAEATSAAGATVTFSASAIDVVNGGIAATCAPASDSTFALGTVEVLCSATDAAGNTGTSSFSVTVEDTTDPVVTVPSAATAEATGPGGAQVVYDAATAEDIVDGSVSTSCSPASNSTFALGSTTVTCSATDAAGNTGTASFTVKVVDTMAPAVHVPANLVVGNTSSTGAANVAYSGATATDLVSGDVPVICDPASGGFFQLGVTTVTCSATDGAGNTGTETFIVEVQDQTKPVVTVPANIVKEATGADGATVTYFGVSATDDVNGIVTATCDTASGTVFPLGITTVTCSATDEAGNKGDNSFTVTVTDTTPPTLTVSEPKTAVATSSAGATVTYTAPTASDLVDGIVAASCDKPSGSVFPLGSTTVSCSAADAAGNLGIKTFTVTVTTAWSNVLQPINVNGTSVFKVGSTVPVKFALTGASAGIGNLVATLWVQRVNAAPGSDVEAISTSNATTGNLFRYDATAGQYIFNLGIKTLSAGTYQLRIDLGDGVLHTVNITLR
jgi:hypothetical protein